METWKTIEGYEGQYQVSSCGRVRSLERIVQYENHVQTLRTKLLFGSQSHGYHRVTFSDKKDFAVHRLVAEAFIPNPESKPDVNHIDGDPLNNFADNLEWVTHQENMQHAVNTGLRRTNPVMQFKPNGDWVANYVSIAEAARALGKPDQHSNIRKACLGQRRLALGFMWQYDPEKCND